MACCKSSKKTPRPRPVRPHDSLHLNMTYRHNGIFTIWYFVRSIFVAVGKGVCWCFVKKYNSKKRSSKIFPVKIKSQASSDLVHNAVSNIATAVTYRNLVCDTDSSCTDVDTHHEFINQRKLHRSCSLSSLTNLAAHLYDPLSNGDGFQISKSRVGTTATDENGNPVTRGRHVLNVMDVDVATDENANVTPRFKHDSQISLVGNTLLKLTPKPKKRQGLTSFLLSNNVGTLTTLQICALLRTQNSAADRNIALAKIADLKNANVVTPQTFGGNTAETTEESGSRALAKSRGTLSFLEDTDRDGPVTVATESLILPILKKISFGPNPVEISEARILLHQHPETELITVKFDLRESEELDREEKCFLLLEAIFQHTGVQELVVNVDNWRNHVLKKEHILPEDDDWKFEGGKMSYPIRIKWLTANVQGLSFRHLLKWREFLNLQDELHSLHINLDSVSWTLYRKVFKNNRNTLSRLELYNLTNHNGDISTTERFDFALLNRLENLQILKLWGDCRYYGLRTMNFDLWYMERLKEIELKYVDLMLPDIRHLLKAAPWLRIAALLFFTPIPEESNKTPLPVAEFLYLIACVMAERKIHQLIFLDYKLPDGPNNVRKKYLGDAAKQYGYTCSWPDPGDLQYDSMEFKIKIE